MWIFPSFWTHWTTHWWPWTAASRQQLCDQPVPVLLRWPWRSHGTSHIGMPRGPSKLAQSVGPAVTRALAGYSCSDVAASVRAAWGAWEACLPSVPPPRPHKLALLVAPVSSDGTGGRAQARLPEAAGSVLSAPGERRCASPLRLGPLAGARGRGPRVWGLRGSPRPPRKGPCAAAPGSPGGRQELTHPLGLDTALSPSLALKTGAGVHAECGDFFKATWRTAGSAEKQTCSPRPVQSGRRPCLLSAGNATHRRGPRPCAGAAQLWALLGRPRGPEVGEWPFRLKDAREAIKAPRDHRLKTRRPVIPANGWRLFSRKSQGGQR